MSILRQPLRLVVYDSAFNSICHFLVIFGILLPNRVVSANQGFRRFSQYFYVLQSLEANQTIINKYRRFVNFFFFFFRWILVFISLWIQGNPSLIRGLLVETDNLVFVSSRKYRVHFLQASMTSFEYILSYVIAKMFLLKVC